METIRSLSEMFMIDTLSHPHVLWLILLLPVSICCIFRYRKKIFPSIKLPTLAGTENAFWSGRIAALILSISLFCLCYIFMVIAMAHPLGGSADGQRSEGINVYFVLDMSASMKAYDLSIDEIQRRYREDKEMLNRFEVARDAIRQFVKARSKLCHGYDVLPRCDRVGMVLFGQEAYLDVPLTTNYESFLQQLDMRSLDDIDSSQSAIGDGMMRAVASLRHVPDRSRSIILLTDGDRKGGRYGIEQAISAARLYHVKVFPVSIGSEGHDSAVVSYKNPNGSMGFREVDLPVNREVLDDIATKTGGWFFRESDRERLVDGLERIADDLDPEISITERKAHQIDLSLNYAVISFVLLLLSCLVYLTAVRRYP